MYAKSDNKATCPKISLNFKQHVIFVSDSRLACLPWNERLRQRAAGSLEIGMAAAEKALATKKVTCVRLTTVFVSVNNRPVKQLPLVARLPPAFYIVPYAAWNYGILTPFYNSKLGSRLTNLTCMHTLEKKQTLVFLIQTHFA